MSNWISQILNGEYVLADVVDGTYEMQVLTDGGCSALTVTLAEGQDLRLDPTAISGQLVASAPKSPETVSSSSAINGEVRPYVQRADEVADATKEAEQAIRDAKITEDQRSEQLKRLTKIASEYAKLNWAPIQLTGLPSLPQEPGCCQNSLCSLYGAISDEHQFIESIRPDVLGENDRFLRGQREDYQKNLERFNTIVNGNQWLKMLSSLGWVSVLVNFALDEPHMLALSLATRWLNIFIGAVRDQNADLTFRLNGMQSAVRFIGVRQAEIDYDRKAYNDRVDKLKKLIDKYNSALVEVNDEFPKIPSVTVGPLCEGGGMSVDLLKDIRDQLVGVHYHVAVTKGAPGISVSPDGTVSISATKCGTFTVHYQLIIDCDNNPWWKPDDKVRSGGTLTVTVDPEIVCYPDPDTRPCEDLKTVKNAVTRCDEWSVTSQRCGAQDPNDIVGPVGAGEQNWIGRGQTFDYMIRYENDAKEASVPAAVVQVTQVLDPDLDLTTFRLGIIGFGDTTIEQAVGKTSFRTRLNLISQFGIYLDVSAGLDLQTRTVSWELKSIDPETGEVPFSPLIGFLPPNENGSEGLGYVTYSVKPKATAASGTHVDAVATIVFDQNEPIATPAIFHTLDADAPHSSVLGVPSGSNARQFLVAWAGADDPNGSGVGSYDVFVSTDGDNYVRWLAATAATQATFTGEFGHSYAFYSLARDLVGHIEAKTPQAEAQTSLVEPTPITVTDVIIADSPSAEVAVTFGDALTIVPMIDDGSIFSAVSLLKLSGETVDLHSGTFSFDDTTHTLTWTRTGSLPAGYYELRLDGSRLTDAVGNLLMGGHGGNIAFPMQAFDSAAVVPAGGTAVQVDGYSVPALADWNNDGRPDLIVGEKTTTGVGKVRVYLNMGTVSAPVFGSFTYVQSNGADFAVPASGCLGAFPRVFDWDGDGEKDLLVGTADGKIQLLLNTNTDAAPQFGSPTYFQVGLPDAKTDLDVGDRAAFDIVDWNNDGQSDLVVGRLDGRVHVFLNQAASGPADFQTDTVLQEDSGDLLVPTGRASVDMADLNGDGRKDLLVGNTDGQLLFYANIGADAAPAFSGFEAVHAGGAAIVLGSGTRSRPFVGDFNHDGVLDILLGSADGLVRFYAGHTASPIVGDYNTNDGNPGETYVYTFNVLPNQPPTDIILAPSSVAENRPAGTVVGTLATTDPDDTVFTYALVAGSGDTDNGRFSLDNGQLKTNAVFDFESKSSYTVLVRTTDAANQSVEKIFAITVLDVDEIAPTVAINQAGTQADPAASLPLHFTVIFSEPVADFAMVDVSLGGTAPGAAVGAVTAVGTDGRTYDVTVIGLTSGGTVIATIAAGVSHDAAGNPNLASTSTDNAITYITAEATISGFVYFDGNNNGVKERTDLGLRNVPIMLSGPVTRTTTTGQDGSYTFDHLPTGTYTVSETQPSAFLDGRDTLGSPASGSVGNDCFVDVAVSGNVQLTNYNFGERGLRPELINLEMFYVSNLASDQLLQELDLTDGKEWFRLQAASPAVLTAALPAGTPRALELYASDWQPLAIGAGQWVLNARVEARTTYVLHVAADSGTNAGLVAFNADLGSPFATFENGPFTNPNSPYDINGDGQDSPLDALQAINEVNQRGPRLLLGPHANPPYFDVNHDEYLTALDVLQVIHRLDQVAVEWNASAPAAEGEALGGGVLETANSITVGFVESSSPVAWLSRAVQTFPVFPVGQHGSGEPCYKEPQPRSVLSTTLAALVFRDFDSLDAGLEPLLDELAVGRLTRTASGS